MPQSLPVNSKFVSGGEAVEQKINNKYTYVSETWF